MANILLEIPNAKALFGDLARNPSIPRPKAVSSGRPHRVLWTGLAWRCVQCARTFSNQRPKSPCAALTPSLRQ
eukprot:203338-Pyramimonas_sp.AAC.1